jgi:hypothetical protein
MYPFGPWLPDIAPFESSAATVAHNVVPAERSYRPWRQHVGGTYTFDTPIRGAISVGRSTAKETQNFCGTATKLYQLGANADTWNDVSRLVGGIYNIGDTGFWQFAAFGDTLIGVNGVDAAQTFTLGSSSNFAALAGSPPISQFITIVRDFVVMGALSTGLNRIAWSAINNPTNWTPSAETMSGNQSFPEGGAIKGLAGGDYGLVFCDRAIYRMSFEGPPTIFRFDRIAQQMGCRASLSIASYENLTFFLSYDGLYMVRGASEIVPIGASKVDEWFQANVNREYIDKVTGAIDPERKLYVMSFPKGAATQCDTVLIYHWVTGQWTTADLNADYITTASAQRILTIDDLPSVGATIDDLPGTLDSTLYSGVYRARLAAFGTNRKFGFFDGQTANAIVETGDIQLSKGRKSLLRSLRPMVHGDGVLPSIIVKYKDDLHDSFNETAATQVASSGRCSTRVNARYHRATVSVPANTNWEHATGVDDVVSTPMGVR